MFSFLHTEINSEDPRDLSLNSQQNYRTVPTHYFLWRPHSKAPVLHLVIFYRRGDYIWHASAVTKRKPWSVPVNASKLTVGQHAGSLDRSADNHCMIYECEENVLIHCYIKICLICCDEIIFILIYSWLIFFFTSSC